MNFSRKLTAIVYQATLGLQNRQNRTEQPQSKILGVNVVRLIDLRRCSDQNKATLVGRT